MTETRTTRLGLPQWSSGTSDSPSREDFNEAFANLEKWAGRFETGLLSERRGPQFAGTFYVDENGTIYRDTGTIWQTIGTPKNSLNIVKESGTDPAIRAEVPLGMTNDAIRTVHNGKTRFSVTATGDVVASSTRLYQSDTLPPNASLPTTLGLIPKSGAAAGITVWGMNGQVGNLIETRTSSGADLTQLTPTGDIYTFGRGSIGGLAPAESQFFVKGSQETRPVILARTASALPSNGPFIVGQNSDGSQQLFKIDATGRMAVGNRNSATIYTGDLLALNTDFNTTNNGATPLPQGRLVFRNGASGYGVAGLDIRQEAGDGPGTTSLGIFAGTSPYDGTALERVRFGITPDKTGARFTSQEAQWTPFVVRGAAAQSAPLLSAQNANGTMLAEISEAGKITANELAVRALSAATFGGGITAAGAVQGSQLLAVQGSGTAVGVISQIKTAADTGAHFTARDENGIVKARINRDGTLEIGSDPGAIAAGGVLLTMRGQQYRQNGRKLQSFDADSGRWGSIESAFGSEYYSSTSQRVDNAWVNINWAGETNDTELAYAHTAGSSIVKVPFTGWYDVRALSHVDMNFTGAGSATFRINGALEMKYRRDYPRATGLDTCTMSLNDLVFMNKNDTIQMAVKIDSFFFTVYTRNSGDYRSRMALRFTGNA